MKVELIFIMISDNPPLVSENAEEPQQALLINLIIP